MNALNRITNRDFFYCYNPKLSKFLEQNGIEYFLKAKSIKDGKIFTMYKRDSELSRYLVEYKKLNIE